MFARALLSCFALALCAGLAACGRYQLGTDTEVPFDKLHVSIIKSETLIPQAHALVTTQLREAFIKDGRVHLVDSPEEADAVRVVTLENSSRDVNVAQATDTGLARRYDVTLTARATLTDRRAGKNVFAARPLAARRGVFVDSGSVQAEYQTLPLLAERLAEDALRAVLERW